MPRDSKTRYWSGFHYVFNVLGVNFCGEPESSASASSATSAFDGPHF